MRGIAQLKEYIREEMKTWRLHRHADKNDGNSLERPTFTRLNILENINKLKNGEHIVEVFASDLFIFRFGVSSQFKGNVLAM